MGAVNTTYTFTATDTITSTKMNNIIDQTTMTTDAIFGTTLDIVSGQLKVRTQGITSSEMAADSVLAISIKDANVTPAKLSNSDFGAFTVASGVATLDADVVTTAKILNANVTAAKLDGAQTGTAPIYGIRAWGRFDGTGSSSISPVYGGNIASITRSSLGVFNVLFTTPMIDANYSVVVSGDNPIQTNNQAYSTSILSAITANGFTVNYPSTSANPSIICFQVIR